MKRRSIRFKMTAILISIVGFVLLFSWLLNLFFSERYYLSIERSSIIQSFEEVKTSLAEENDFFSINDSLEQLSNRTNVKMMVAMTNPSTYQQNVIFSNMSDGTRAYQELLDYLSDLRNRLLVDSDSLLNSDKSDLSNWLHPSFRDELQNLVKKGYLVVQMRDDFSGQNGLYLFGFIDDDYMVAMRVSIDGIRFSIRILSNFLAMMSIIAIIFGILFIWVYTYQFTKPIKEMAHVADQMTKLNFKTKVKNHGEDEIGTLGTSINKLSDALESTIADLKTANIELQKDIEKKEEIDEMRKEFLSHVSHELKTPIAIIQGYAEGLKDGIVDDQESMDFYCEVILDEAQKMNNMVRKLLTLNQLEFGTAHLNISHFNLKEMIRNKLNSSSILYQGKDIQVVYEEEADVFVWADEFMMEEVFMNYLTNAIHYVCDKGMVRIWHERIGDSIRTYVFNEGDPIPQEELDKLWIKFYKVDKSRSRSYGGNGIGLSIVAAAMRAHNKNFGVENRENGVVFYFDLEGEIVTSDSEKE
ncbi:MAG: HAMP domain-containing sensor histidine kinase [Eubacteriales bacterium]|nr:HAMP domain-containing sensor histidine kinase [Eubacteriales bacterium]